jgi:hypothetical protein
MPLSFTEGISEKGFESGHKKICLQQCGGQKNT